MQNDQLRDHFKKQLLAGTRYHSIVQARKEAATLTGESFAAGSPAAKALEQSIEAGVVLAARQLVQGCSAREGFDRLVDLYERQPNLAIRSSTSIRDQAYSTPVPIAFLASSLAGIGPETSIYEPTAGNGTLLLPANPQLVIANEINPERAQSLERQGFPTTQFDASVYLPDQQVDIVVLNPPFGVVKDNDGNSREWMAQGGPATNPYRTTQIDHQIALNALRAMKDDGSAVLILGAPLANKTGNLQSASKTYNNLQNRAFYKSLYDNYQVVDHFCVGGNLYARQGTSFPVDVVVIEGRGKSSLPLPAVEPPRLYSAFEKLGDYLSDRIARHSLRVDATHQGYLYQTPDNYSGAGQRTGSQAGEQPPRLSPSEPLLDGTGQSSLLDDLARERSPGGPDSDPDCDETGFSLGDSLTRDREALRLGSSPNNQQPHPPGEILLPSSPGPAQERATPPIPHADGARQSNHAGDRPGNFSGGVARQHDNHLQRLDMEDQPGTEQAQEPKQVAYVPKSQATSVDTLLPANMRSAVANALDNLEQRVGNIDDYVASRLAAEKDTLYQRFSAEQVDALGLAISNLEQRQSFIIGDQTGIGKGRFVAGIIEFTRQQGLVPIFITQDEKLYGDMMRDLSDIGVTDIKPLLTNINSEVPLPNGETLKTKSTHGKVIKQFAQAGNIGSHDAIFTTYSQLQTVRGKETDRRDLLHTIAPRSVLILDESHNAGGSGQDQRGSFSPPDRAEFVRQLVERSAGCVYSSATYAKNPYTMTLYAAKTGMRDIVADRDELVEIVKRGGIPLQQMIASNLAEAGQYIRRERSYDGIEFDAKAAPVSEAIADQLSHCMSLIMAFDEAKREAIDEYDKELKSQAKQLRKDNSTGETGASSVNFTALMHNVIGQSLLALKAEATVQEALAALGRDEKPVIALANTMGSAIGRAADDQDLLPGDPIDLDMGDVLHRYLDRSRDVITKDYEGKTTRERLTDKELGIIARIAYDDASDAIRDYDWAGLPISPIDYIRHRLEEEGYRTGEITGREDRIEYGPNGQQLYQVRSNQERDTVGTIQTVRGFNSGAIDALIINRSGSTGISLHASQQFEDQRPRRMIVTQPDLNIDVFMQTLGRIHRTGQVVNPAFTLLMGDVPAEKRPAAILLQKMASLNANTTAARDSGFSLGSTTDFMNSYGDQVAIEVMASRPDIHAKLGHPIKGIAGDETDLSLIDPDRAVAKVTGRIPLLPVQEQGTVYDLLEQGYKDLLASQEAMGQSTLQAERLDLQAITLSRMEVMPPLDGAQSNAFCAAVTLEVIDAKALRKPRTTLEVINVVREELGLAPVSSTDAHDSSEAKNLASQKSEALVARFSTQVEAYRQQKLQAIDPSQSPSNQDSQTGEEIEDDPKAKAKAKVFEKKLDYQAFQVTQILEQFPVGQPVRMIAQDDGSCFYGVISQVIDKTSEGNNPANLGSWQLQIQVADSARQINLPFSKINRDIPSSIDLTPEENTRFGSKPILGLFDEQQTLAREQRQVFTGNVVRAFSQYKGKLINFTDDQGALRQGLLMPKGFDILESLDKAPVPFPSPEQAESFLKSPGRVRLKTKDEHLSLWMGENDLFLSTPRQKSTGGRYYLDEGLLNVAQKEFISSGDSMFCTIPRDQAPAVLEYLYGESKVLFAFDERALARQMLGVTLPSLDPVTISQSTPLPSTPPPVQIALGLELPSPTLETPPATLLSSTQQTPPQPSSEPLPVPTPTPEVIAAPTPPTQPTIETLPVPLPSLTQVATPPQPSSEPLAVPTPTPEVITAITAPSTPEKPSSAPSATPVTPTEPSGPSSQAGSPTNEPPVPLSIAPPTLTQPQDPIQGVSPTLQDLRNWAQASKILDQPSRPLAYITTLAQQMIAGSGQEHLQPNQRDPNFANPHFFLSPSDQSSLNHDLKQAASITNQYNPSLQDMRDWIKNAKTLARPQKYLDRIKELAADLIAGTSQESMPPVRRNPKFHNPRFFLSEQANLARQRDLAEALQFSAVKSCQR